MRKLAFFLPVISGSMWGASGVFIRKLSSFGMDNSTILFSRAAIAAVLIFIAVLFYDRTLLKVKIKDIWLFLACGLLGMLGMSLCYNEAVNRLPLSLAAVLMGLTPAFVMIMAAFLFKEKITAKKTACLLLALAGCILASGILEGMDSAGISPAGILAGVVTAFFYALYSIFSKMASERGYSTYTIIFYSMISIAVALLPFSDLGLIGDFVREAPISNTVFMIAQAMCTSMLPYIFYTVALLYMEAGRVSILASGAEPVAAVCFGVIFYGEIPTILTIAGMAVTITALTLLCMKDKKVKDERGELA
ncbi:MAG: DMT family transporter [Ruminococcus sp.]|jgi:drug/metabolite transporter (DMT)-like permease